MGEPWFLAPADAWLDDEIVLPADETHHATQVLRIKPPDLVTVTDGRGTVARCAAVRVEGERLVTTILDREHLRPIRPEIVVYQGMAKGHKLDGIVARLAELGAAEAWVYESRRSVARWDSAKLERLGERWRAIARGAAKQARSPHLMDVGGGLSWTELLRRIAREQLTIALWEEASLPLRTALVGEADRVALVVGPEGGLERNEAESLADQGAQLVSLGPRILRTENAAVVGITAVMYHFGLIG